MSEPYLGEIRLFGFNFPPRGWAKCDGQVLPIEKNQALYSILGTTYGGDGRTTFALPDLRGRVPIHVGNNGTTESIKHTLGHKDGEENVTLTVAQMPSHTHTMRATGDAALSGVPGATPNDHVLAEATTNIYTGAANLAAMNTVTVSNNVGGQPLDNMQPFLAVEFCIAIEGIFPPRN